MEASLHRAIGREEFDYPALMAALSTYANPHVKITSLLKKGVIIRVKKGLYIFGEDDRRRPFSRELLANLAYGPSFVSLDYALARHGLIPERVEALTSVTTGRARVFETPVGSFIYRHTPVESFHLGMKQFDQEGVSYLMATPERALADKIREDRSARVQSLAEAERYLMEDLRIDERAASILDLETFKEMARAIRSRKGILCARFLEKSGVVA